MDYPPPYELYRDTTLGRTLIDTLDELVNSEQITSDLAMRVLKQFDKSVAEWLGCLIKSKGTFNGHLHTYRNCDEVWTFVVDDGRFRIGDEEVKAPRLNIVACKFKKSGESNDK